MAAGTAVDSFYGQAVPTFAKGIPAVLSVDGNISNSNLVGRNGKGRRKHLLSTADSPRG